MPTLQCRVPDAQADLYSETRMPVKTVEQRIEELKKEIDKAAKDMDTCFQGGYIAAYEQAIMRHDIALRELILLERELEREARPRDDVYSKGTRP